MTASTSSSEKVLLDYDGPVAIISNNNPDKRNAFDDEMDLRLFEILAELSERLTSGPSSGGEPVTRSPPDATCRPSGRRST